MHFSGVLLVIEILVKPDFCNESITEGETPPAPITSAFLFWALSTSFK